MMNMTQSELLILRLRAVMFLENPCLRQHERILSRVFPLMSDLLFRARETVEGVTPQILAISTTLIFCMADEKIP